MRILTTGRVARALGVHRDTVRQWVHKGEIIPLEDPADMDETPVAFMFTLAEVKRVARDKRLALVGL